MENKIIVVDANVSLEPYIKAAEETVEFESQLEKMGFEVKEDPPSRKIGFLAAADRSSDKP